MTERQFQNRGVGEEYTGDTVEIDITKIQQLLDEQARQADKAGTLSGKVEEVVTDAINVADRVMRWFGH